MSVVVTSLILFWLLAWAAFCAIDVWRECRIQTEIAEHEELLDQLWDEEATA